MLILKIIQLFVVFYMVVDAVERKVRQEKSAFLRNQRNLGFWSSNLI